MLIKAQEVMDILGVSKTQAYRIIQNLNDSLNEKGYRTVQGKTSRKFFYENYFLEPLLEVSNVNLQG